MPKGDGPNNGPYNKKQNNYNNKKQGYNQKKPQQNQPQQQQAEQQQQQQYRPSQPGPDGWNLVIRKPVFEALKLIIILQHEDHMQELLQESTSRSKTLSLKIYIVPRGYSNQLNVHFIFTKNGWAMREAKLRVKN